jgi:hypothetical protein
MQKFLEHITWAMENLGEICHDILTLKAIKILPRKF